MIKYFKIILIVFILSFSQLKAQSIEIIPQTSYTFGGRIYTGNGEFKIQNSEIYGLSANLVKNNIAFQFEYFYQPTVGDYKDYFNLNENQISDLNINWYQFGVRQRFKTSDKFVPFGGLSVGITHFNLNSVPRSYDEVALSISVQSGANLYLSERLGLRFHGRLMSPVQFRGFGFYAGSGGSGFGGTAGSYFVQADVGVGLIIRFSQE